MLGLTPGELGMVIAVFLLVAGAARLPSWGEALGGYFHRRKEANRRSPDGGGEGARRD